MNSRTLPPSLLPGGRSRSTLQPVQPNKLETLDDLLAYAEQYATRAMRKLGRVPPALLFINSRGAQIYSPENLPDVEAKDDFADVARLLCIAHAATACVLAFEAWSRPRKPGESLEDAEAPSEAVDRQEIVALLGESRDHDEHRTLPIIRSGNGKFFGFDSPEISHGKQMEGRFGGILPPEPPTPRLRKLAREALAAYGLPPAPRRP